MNPPGPVQGTTLDAGSATAAAAGAKRPPAIERTNDFVVKFANVNGSGSASANGLFAKAVLRMGVPLAARNIFPSNIQGMPTWYEVRIVERGWRGRRGGVDLAVPMNPETWNADVAEIEPGGYLFYDSTRPLTSAKLREDVHVLGMPLTAICADMFSDMRQRQLFKNIMYVGALAALLDIEPAVIETLLAEQFGGEKKAPLLDANRSAFRRGFSHAKESLPRIGLHMERRDNVGDRIFIDGNSAAGLGAVYGGATVCAWYPITPSTSLAEAFQTWCQKFRTDPATGKHRYAIVQAEDELASIGMVVGAGWNGARAFTATAGPGISLMQEFIGLAYFAEIPAVLFDVQRGSPSTGMPTKTQQADILSAAYASHGDTKHVLLFPEDPTECFSMGALAFDLADRLQTPVFVMLDLDIGMQDWLTAPFEWDDRRALDRGKVMSADELEAGGTSAVTSTWTAMASRIERCPERIRAAARTSREARRRTATRATPKRARPTSTTCSAFCASSTPHATSCPARSSKRQPTRPVPACSGTGRRGHRWPRRSQRSRVAASSSTASGSGPFRSPTPSRTSSPTTTASSSSSRTAMRSFARS